MGGALLTAFGPFPGAPENPTPSVIADAAGSNGARTLVLRTEYAAVPGALAQAALHDPETVVMTGLAAGAERVRIELIARNAAASDHPDSAGARRAAETILTGAPDTLETTADLPALFAALSEAGIDHEISRDAGGYVCNFAYFHALRCFPAAQVVFVHLPLTETAFVRQVNAGLVDGPARQRLIPHAEAVRVVGAVLASQRRTSPGP